VKTFKNLFLYSLLLAVLVLLTSFITNIQVGGTGNAGNDQVMALKSQRQECGAGTHNDFTGIRSDNETDDNTNGLSCGDDSEPQGTNYELAAILLFGTALIGVGVAVRRWRF
jgi:hypothetical protein